MGWEVVLLCSASGDDCDRPCQVHSRLVGLEKVKPGCLRIIKDFIIANKYYAID